MGCGQSGGQTASAKNSQGGQANDKQQAKEENKQYQAGCAAIAMKCVKKHPALLF